MKWRGNSSEDTRRPNLIGASVITVMKVDENAIVFQGVDVLDGTPVLDLKVQKD